MDLVSSVDGLSLKMTSVCLFIGITGTTPILMNKEEGQVCSFSFSEWKSKSCLLPLLMSVVIASRHEMKQEAKVTCIIQ